LQDNTRYYIYEARRALGHAALSYITKEKTQYLGWMENAIDLLLQAEECRAEALKEPWSHLTNDSE